MNPIRQYTVEKITAGVYFCPVCHRRVEPPEFMLNSNIKAENGIMLACGICKRGKVQIKVKPKEPADVVSNQG